VLCHQFVTMSVSVMNARSLVRRRLHSMKMLVELLLHAIERVMPHICAATNHALLKILAAAHRSQMVCNGVISIHQKTTNQLLVRYVDFTIYMNIPYLRHLRQLLAAQPDSVMRPPSPTQSQATLSSSIPVVSALQPSYPATRSCTRRLLQTYRVDFDALPEPPAPLPSSDIGAPALHGCRKLHQDPGIYSEFPRFFPKTICAGFRSRDPGAYPCRVAALISAKTPEFPLSLSYLYLISRFYSCRTIVPHTFLLLVLLWSDINIVRCIFCCHVA
jgi:hypothetical protein